MLRVNVKNFGNVATLCLQGRIIRGETEALRDVVNSQVGVTTLVLDLGGVNTIDAGGLGLLLELREQSESKGVEFRLKNVTKLVKRVLEITRLNSVFDVSAETRAPLVNLHGPSSAVAAATCGWLRETPTIFFLSRCRSGGFHPS